MNQSKNSTLKLLQAQSIENHVAYVRDQSLRLINEMIVSKQVHSILELGSGIGYSAYALSLNACVQKIITIERDTKRYLLAKANLANNAKIHVENIDAIDYQTNDYFDLIFFDANKTHQKELFEKFSKKLASNGLIIIDNIFLKKYEDQKKLNKNQRNLMAKIHSFEKYLKSLSKP